MSKRLQPPWKVDSSEPVPSLRVYNSLTRKKEVFVPKKNNQVLWYSCGPTVYDASHMGHARSYISFDILRRILQDYFHYDVFYVMNITDIDDKIIKKARKDFFYQNFIKESETKPVEEILVCTKKAVQLLVEKSQKTTDQSVKDMISRLSNDIELSIKNVEDALKGNDQTLLRANCQRMLVVAEDPIGDMLDKELSSTINDNSIFSELPRYWEQKFHEDMDALSVQRPDVLTRVSEYVPEIIEYIEKLVKSGLAYESNGSVYFDVTKFDSEENHTYAKLVPEAYENIDLLEDGEGEFTELKEKKRPTDFALWKRSKQGEPWWPSPWGNGRPGWHIECSVMASALLGESLDIHTGGVDLKFPHHDNELAQAEAYWDNDCWVRYFLHSGHLTIAGCKMSKSLKNFVTINEALKEYSSRQIRFVFLLHGWGDTLDYSKNTMETALSYEKMFMEFFLNVKDMINSSQVTSIDKSFEKWTSKEIKLHEMFVETKKAVHCALCDNIDTRTCLMKLKECITQCNIYLKDNSINLHLIENIATYVTYILEIFGIISEKKNIGFSTAEQLGSSNVEDILRPYLKALGEFRDEVRLKAKEAKNTNILDCCDNLRDNILPELSVRLEDREGKPSAIKLVDKEILLKEKEQKERIKLEKEKAKATQQAEKEAKEALKKLAPKEMFLGMTDKYSAFDSEGLPTHDSEGKEVSKNLRSKLKKLQIRQETLLNGSTKHENADS